MKKLLVSLSILAFLFTAGTVSADWIDDIKPLPAKIDYISVKFQGGKGSNGVVVLKTKDGICIEYKIFGDKVVKTRTCSDVDWKDFVKK